ncbi:hypothetical protein HN51_070080 [Arachis hypogaea]
MSTPARHRFLLNANHLTELGSLYSFSEESRRSSSMDPTGRNQAYHAKVSKNASRGKVHRCLNEIHDGLIYTSIPPNEHNLAYVVELAKTLNHAKEFGKDLQAINMDGDDLAFSMLNRNLPIYMICPHCRNYRHKKDTPKVKFASGISQLKRIFMVTPPLPVILATCPNIQFELDNGNKHPLNSFEIQPEMTAWITKGTVL